MVQLADMESHGSYRHGNRDKEYAALLQQELKHAKGLAVDRLEKAALKQEAKKKKKQAKKRGK